MSIRRSLKAVTALSEQGELERLRIAIAGAGDAVFDWTAAGDGLGWFGPVDTVFGRGAAAKLVRGNDYLRGVAETGRAARERAVRQAIVGGSTYAVTYQFSIGDREQRWVEERGTCFLDEAGELARIVGTARDITDQKTREAHLTFAATYDPLTGHLNRTRLCASLSQTLMLAQRHDRPGAYMVIGIDGLATINEAQGYDVADILIQQVGDRISLALRDCDLVGRIAGNKFGVVIPNTDRPDLDRVAERLLQSVRDKSFETPAGKIIATISIGCVSLDKNVHSAEDALGRAEEALDTAKRAGRDGFAHYAPSEDKLSWRKRNRQMADAIVSALDDGRMRLAYQPIVETDSSDVAMYECLIRMERQNGEIAGAGEFIPIAEQLGIVRLIDQRVQELVLQEAMHAPGVNFTFNVSGLTANDTPWMRKFLSMMERYREVAERLVVEITETVALHEIDESANFIRLLREMGCRVAIDDFGAGYTSFRNLQALNVDIVKIDGAFVRDLATNKDNRLFVKTLVDLAKNFGVEIVAEWVETQAEVDILRDYGVDYLQGYHFGAASLETPWR